MTAQILDVTPEQYHALPQFSATMAKALISRSPLHAKELRGKEPTPAMDFGSVGHRLTLGAGKEFKPLPFNDWRTNDAKAAREAARKAGLVPIKEEDFKRARDVSDRVRAELLDLGIALDGASELAIEWEEPTEFGPVACRCMMDHVWLATGRILDLKFTGDASHVAVQRSAENMGYAIQEAAYRRALAKLRPELAGRVDFLFAFAETEAPFAVNVCRGDGTFRELGERRWLRAVAEWARCTKENRWPAFGRGINPLSPPGWALAREEEQAA